MMLVFFDFQKFPLADALPILLIDQTTRKNIIFATDEYKESIPEADKTAEIQEEFFSNKGLFIEPRVVKTSELQQTRTKQKAEVFTPSWVCNQMNNDCDEQYFGIRNVFNTENGQTWTVSTDKVLFKDESDWKKYVDSARLEITCGEAPFLVSRYDTLSGELIPVEQRIGILDRKIRIVSENTSSEEDWLKWTTRAFQSAYGYEFQGDSLLIARCNLLLSFCEYVSHYLNRDTTLSEILEIANIISWNIWQMDGLTKLLPFEEIYKKEPELNLFDDENPGEEKVVLERTIFDWKNSKKLKFMTEEEMKFDFVIGNPPYQGEPEGNNTNYSGPVYHYFMDAAYSLSDKVELIHPARFLFNAGGTRKDWNQKMLNDPHFKILKHEPVSANLFPGTDIKGGVVISYRDQVRRIRN